MFKKIFKFLEGYVIIEVTGKNKEKFINMCLDQGIWIISITPKDKSLKMSVLRRDFCRMRHIVRKCAVRVRITEKHGSGEFYKKYRRRYGLFIIGLVVIIGLVLFPKYIWCIQIEGAKTADISAITQILADMGVYIGAKKSGISDLGDIKGAIVSKNPDVNWAWLYIDGAKARLVIQEAVMPPYVKDKTTPQSIIAGCDGYIKAVRVRRGQKLVSEGMSVAKGDMLVSGKVAVFREGDAEKYSYVNSDAEIIADTLRCARGTFSNIETLRIKTGRSKKKFSIEAWGREIDIPFIGKNDFKDCDINTQNYDLNLPLVGYSGLTLNISTVYEVNEIEHTITEAEVIERAKHHLEEDICKRLGVGAVKTQENITYSKNGDKYTVLLKMNFTENIGIKIPQEE